MYEQPLFETPRTLAAIRRAPIESFELLRQFQDYNVRLSQPRVVATSAGIRLVREISATKPFWLMWGLHCGNLTKLGIVLSKDEENRTARLWTRLAPNVRPIIRISDPIELETGCLLYRLVLLGTSSGWASP
jgi:hypothetical protein